MFPGVFPGVLLGSLALALSIVVGVSRASEADYYALLTIPPPDELKLEITGMDTLDDGRLAASIRKGEVWVFDNAYARPPEELRGTRFARALHEPLGLRCVGDDLFVVQRSELTRLRDLDGDGQADEYRWSSPSSSRSPTETTSRPATRSSSP